MSTYLHAFNIMWSWIKYSLLRVKNHLLENIMKLTSSGFGSSRRVIFLTIKTNTMIVSYCSYILFIKKYNKITLFNFYHLVQLLNNFIKIDTT